MTRSRWMALFFASGSTCFLIGPLPGYLQLVGESADGWHGWPPARGGAGWWQPAVNLLGCLFFGISAIAGHLVPSTGSILDLAAANWNTCLGAACFLACAVATLRGTPEAGGVHPSVSARA